MAMPEFQQYHLNINLIKNVKDTVVFLTRKLFISVSFSIAFFKQITKPKRCKSSHGRTLEIMLTVPLTKSLNLDINACFLLFMG